MATKSFEYGAQRIHFVLKQEDAVELEANRNVGELGADVRSGDLIVSESAFRIFEVR